ncbi:MAG: carbohydrate-binding domain-containing protein, partial [Clostridia bacterium]|nr:carbohydrate-binding domain-containing protein [Clostridia bacterium]
MKKKLLAVLVAVSILALFVPTGWTAAAEDAGDSDRAEQSAELTFTDNGIAETQAGSGYAVNGTTLTVTAAGTYRINGSCSDGSITVSASLAGVTLILDNLSLASSSTAPIVVKKASAVNLHLEGVSSLTDDEDPDNESSSDATVADAFEGAAIKAKSGSTVTFCGDGDLNIVANAKNGIKGGSTAALIFNQSGTITVTGSGRYYGGTVSGAAVNNGIACDGSIVFNQGSFVIKAANDGIKSAPDATDETTGTAIDTDSAGTITVNGGTFDIDVDGDGIQADTALTVNGGTFDIQTWQGCSVWNDTLAADNSCKGLKASGDRATEAGLEPTITISGGTFTLNTGDDALHSDAYATVTGGVFTISTGDDGMHADTSLTLGTEGGFSRDPDVTVNTSYEGLEGGTVYLYSGRYYVVASDDGVNAAGGSSNGSDPGGGSDPFNPGGDPGGHGGPGGNQPGGGDSSSTGDYNIYIYGGDLYVNCDGDGLDSNGGLYLYGGRQAVFSMKSGGDNSALDADGTVLVDGAILFTAGTKGMDGTVQSSWFGSNQKYASSTTSYSTGKIVNTKTGSSGSVFFSYALPKSTNYIVASWPSSVSSSAPSFTTANSVTACRGGSQSHNWNAGSVTTEASSTATGVMTYTCAACGETETRSIPMTVSIDACDHSVETEPAADEGFAVTFAGDVGVSSITVYTTKDYTGESESLAADGATVSRNSDTGEPDSTGSGQLNFTVVLQEGYAISSVTATAGTYKNLKGPSDTGLANTYRITKITAEMTVTIITVACEHGTLAAGTTPAWVWSADYGAATLSYTCAACGETVSVDGTVTSVLTDASTVTFTASAMIGETAYTDSQTAAPFTATFSCDEGVASVSVYYTQDYSAADEENAATAVARDGDTGCPVITGDGQLNFTVILKDGYEIEAVSATSGAYKNIKGPEDTGEENTYRITKVKKDLTVTVVTAASAPVVTPASDGVVVNEETHFIYGLSVG